MFKHPWVLLLMPVIGILAGLAWSQRYRRNVTAGVPATLPALRTLRTRLFRIVPFWGRVLALTLLVFALARPQQATRGEVPPSEGIDIMLTVDTSYSMAAEDFHPYNRLEAAKKAAADFVKKRKNDRIGVIMFGGAAMLTCPLTLDYQSVLEMLDSAYLNMTRAEGTAVGDAIVTGVNHLKESKAKSKVIVLLTDGRSNTGLVTDLNLAAKTAAAFDIKVYTIGTAGKGKAAVSTGDPMQPVVYIEEDLDEPTLREIAALTGGEFYRAKNYAELDHIYGRIDSLEKTKFEVKTYTEYSDKYMYFLAPALLLLALMFVLERTYFRTIP
ncbi:MAG: aerotolerance regulator BatA [Elusimicrobia bacterium HGW-Elusimicrobia-3]|nr:MAG: aerotolerance regulator BatA [Elusimicrobia bacterium HGW-Elusimicrobia-3]